MVRGMKKNISIYILFFGLLCIQCFPCVPSTIGVPQELKQELVRTWRYGPYVELLNTATDSNTSTDLSQFLKIDWFSSLPTGSGHGQILLDVLQKKGDEFFLQALLPLDDTERLNVKRYILIGIDNHSEHSIENLIEDYPQWFKLLHISLW